MIVIDKNSKEELELKIQTREQELKELRHTYQKLTGHLPARDIQDFSWKWSIFMVLGFAFISSMVFLLGIVRSGRDENTGIPQSFFDVDFAYFGILTTYVIVIVLVAQSNKINGYQTLALILGFYCAHWLIYDWSWWLIEIGFGHIGQDPGFWESSSRMSYFIPNAPVWIWLLDAIIGGIISLYTFSIPRNYKGLIPPALYYYTFYWNAKLGVALGLDVAIIFTSSFILTIIMFGFVGTFTYLHLKRNEFPKWLSSYKELKKKCKKENWIFDPLTPPWIFNHSWHVNTNVRVSSVSSRNWFIFGFNCMVSHSINIRDS